MMAAACGTVPIGRETWRPAAIFRMAGSRDTRCHWLAHWNSRLLLQAPALVRFIASVLPGDGVAVAGENRREVVASFVRV